MPGWRRSGHPPRRRGLVREEGGAAILEFALVLPILFGLLAGAYELGRAILVRHVMIEAVQAGARDLSRVPDPSCIPVCAPGATRAIENTLDQIVAGAGLPRAAIRVSPFADARTDTVTMRADVRLGVDLLGMVGLGPALNLTASHRERRLAD